MTRAYRDGREPRYHRLTVDQHDEIKRRQASGERNVTIADAMNLSPATVCRVLRGYTAPRASLADRFARFVDKAGPIVRAELGPCWLWTGGRDTDGYGVVYVDETRVTARASQVAFFIAEGRWPSPCALHHCDNPPCVKAVADEHGPAHVYEGDYMRNRIDMLERGRENVVEPPHPTGERSPRSSLTDAQRVDIRRRRASGETYRTIAESMGIKLSTVAYVCNDAKDRRTTQ